MKYRKKPVVIEAVQWTGNNITDRPKWLDAAISKTPEEVGCVFRVGNELHIFTTEGVMIASPADWIICGIKGELYPCKPDIFAATYEPA